MRLFWTSLVCVVGSTVRPQQTQLESRYSLLQPYEPADNNKWETGAGAKVYKDLIRLTPAEPSRQGYVWSRIPCTMTDWEMTVKFNIGSPDTMGGLGMAFWYVDQRSIGPVFGSSDYWNGLGIFFDNFNDDGIGENPAIVAVYNDGTRQYEAHNDGERLALGKCHAPALRGRSKPSQAKITYKDNRLTVLLALDYDAEMKPQFHQCIDVAINLGVEKFFGVTAATGHPIDRPGLPQIVDNHDLLELIAKDLSASHSEEVLKQRRASYSQEVNKEHKYIPEHRTVTNREFQQGTLTLVHQIASSLQVLENSQIDVDIKLKRGKASQLAGEATNSKKKESEAMLGTQVLNNMESLSQLLTRLVDAATKLAEGTNNAGNINPGANDGENNNGISQGTQAEWKMNYKTLKNDLDVIKNTVSQISQGASNGRGALGGQSTLGVTVKQAVSNELRSFSRSHNKKWLDVQASLQTFIEMSNDYNADKNSDDSSGGSWLQFGLLLVLTVEMATIVGMQFLGRASGSTYDKRRC